MPASRFKLLARKIAKPMTGPLDGRVSDINRRVTHVDEGVANATARLEELTQAVATNAETLVESNSYLGVELRRIDTELQTVSDELETQHAQLHEQYDRIRAEIANLADRSYVERLGLASHVPLAQLDGALAAAINLATGHRGFAAQAGLWFNPPVTVELGPASARIADVNERIVEVPFALGALARLPQGAKVLDVGGAESTFALSAASLGYEVTVVDPQAAPFEHDRLTTVRRRLEEWDPGSARFAAAFFISTVEHFGLGSYGEGAGSEDADRRAIELTRNLLADDGLLVLTTPYGTARIDDFERTYDEEGLSRLLSGWTMVEKRYATRNQGKVWSTTEGAADAEAGVAMVVARPAGRGAEDSAAT